MEEKEKEKGREERKKEEKEKEKGREERKKEEKEGKRERKKKTEGEKQGKRSRRVFFFLLNNHQVDPFRGNPLSGQRNPFKGGGVIRHPFGGLGLETGQKGCHPLLKGVAFF